MKRTAFDPPEYRAFSAQAEVTASFVQTLAANEARARILAKVDRSFHEQLYRGLVRFRLYDIMLHRWVRQGVLSKAWLGTGEEAVSIGAANALRDGDTIGPMIRNAGACFEMGMALSEHFAGYLGTVDNSTGGRDLHVGSLQHGVVAPISHVGSLAPVMAGLALAYKLRGSEQVALTWVGDGASRTGEVHEALNFAAVQRLPLVVVLQNNQIALGSRTSVESATSFEKWAEGYGVEVSSVDGNNVLDVYAATRLAVDRCRAGDGPVVLVAHTFRMGGHATHDAAEARRLFSEDEFAYWGARDPIGGYEAWLLSTGSLGEDPARAQQRLTELEDSANAEVEAAAERALAGQKEGQPRPSTVTDGVFREV